MTAQAPPATASPADAPAPSTAAHAPSPALAAEAVNAAGLEIYRSVEKRGGNACISPYSVVAALAMTYPGSEGETRRQMREALRFPENPEALAASFRALDAALVPARQDPDAAVRKANRVFGEAGYPFRERFLALLASEFGAPLQTLPFSKNPALATEAINRWVEEQTENKIRDLIPPDALDGETRMVLVNAIYFKAPWVEAFPPGATRPQPFHLPDGSTVPADTMNAAQTYGYQEIPGAAAVSIPYRGLPYQFLVLLPQAPLEEFEKTLGPETFAGLSRIPSRKLNLFLPKFRVEPPTLPLAETLEKLGMPSAFDKPRGSANFDAMAPRTGDEYLFISQVFHKTFLEVEEKGTEAAAATAAAMMRATSVMPEPEEPLEVRIDRPFLFAVQHVPTGACLFLGRVADPGGH